MKNNSYHLKSLILSKGGYCDLKFFIFYHTTTERTINRRKNRKTIFLPDRLFIKILKNFDKPPLSKIHCGMKSFLSEML